MKKLILALTASLFLSACGSSSDSDNDEDINYHQAIRGNWEYTDPATQCVETLSFSASTWSVTSANEVANGFYDITNTKKLDLDITTDNGLTDCAGIQEDNTGDSYTFDIRFTNNDTFRLLQIADPDDYLEYKRKQDK